MHCSNIFRSLAAAAGITATVTVAGCGGGTGGGGGDQVTGKLNGAGASFPAAIYQRWFQELQPEGVAVNYQSVGSGAGANRLVIDCDALGLELLEPALIDGRGERGAGAVEFACDLVTPSAAGSAATAGDRHGGGDAGSGCKAPEDVGTVHEFLVVQSSNHQEVMKARPRLIKTDLRAGRT